MTAGAMRDLPEYSSRIAIASARQEDNQALAARVESASVTAPEDVIALLRLAAATMAESLLDRSDVYALSTCILRRIVAEKAAGQLKDSPALAPSGRIFVTSAIGYGYFDRSLGGMRKDVTAALLAVPASWIEMTVFSKRENKRRAPVLFQTLVRCAPEVLAGRTHPLSIVCGCLKINDRDWQDVFREDIRTLLDKQFAADPLRTSLALGFVHRTWRSYEYYGPSEAERIAAGDRFIETAFWVGAAVVEAARLGEVPIDDETPGYPDELATRTFFDKHPEAVKMLLEMGMKDSAHARMDQCEPLSALYLNTMARPEQLANAATGSMSLMFEALKTNPACLESLLAMATKAQARQLLDLCMTAR